MKKNIVLFAVFVLNVNSLFSTEPYEQKKAQPVKYLKKHTRRLRKVYNSINSQDDRLTQVDYQKNRLKIKGLVEAGANPNIRKEGEGDSLLHTVTELDDIEVMKSCLDNGANPNQMTCRSQDDLDNNFETPIYRASSVTAAQLLLAYRANPNHLLYHAKLGGCKGLLHTAALCDRDPELISFLFKSGAAPSVNLLGITPLHDLCWKAPRTTQFAKKAALFMWHEVSSDSRSKKKEKPVDFLKIKSPQLVDQFNAIAAVIPQVKLQQEKELIEFLATKMSKCSADIVISYLGSKKLSYGESAWATISAATSNCGPSMTSKPTPEHQ